MNFFLFIIISRMSMIKKKRITIFFFFATIYMYHNINRLFRYTKEN